jgi:hypothetical protein
MHLQLIPCLLPICPLVHNRYYQCWAVIIRRNRGGGQGFMHLQLLPCLLPTRPLVHNGYHKCWADSRRNQMNKRCQATGSCQTGGSLCV